MVRSSRTTPSRPRAARRTTCVTFREVVADIAYAPSVVQLHQVVPTRYSWLAPIALSFSEYRVASLTFRWTPAGAATDSGQVVGGFTFDSFESTPANFSQISQLAQHRLSPVHRSASWRLPVSRLRTRLWPVLERDALAALPLPERLPYLPAVFCFALRSDRQNG